MSPHGRVCHGVLRHQQCPVGAVVGEMPDLGEVPLAPDAFQSCISCEDAGILVLGPTSVRAFCFIFPCATESESYSPLVPLVETFPPFLPELWSLGLDENRGGTRVQPSHQPVREAPVQLPKTLPTCPRSEPPGMSRLLRASSAVP